MSIREESLTLYALAESSDGSVECPRCVRDYGDSCPAMIEALSDLNDLTLRGIAARFSCLCCHYVFLGVEL